MREIFENATIFYKNGFKEIFDAISVINNGVYTGEIKLLDTNDYEFVQQKFVPLDKIKRIVFLDKKGKSIDIDFKNRNMEEK